MTDRQLALALVAATDVERQARAVWKDAGAAADESERALAVARQATALRKAIEVWINARAMASVR